MTWLKQSTVVTVQLGAFLDATDGVVPETGLATNMDNASTGIRVSKNGAVMIDRNSATAPAHDDDGHYRIALSATDTNTLGTLRIQYEESGVCTPAWRDFMVVTANVWDSFFGADNLQVDAIQFVGETIPAPAVTGVPDVNLTHHVDVAASVSSGNLDVNVALMGANVLTAAAINAAALNGKGDWNIGKTGYSLIQAFPTNFADMSIVVTTGLVDITQAAADKAWSTAARILTAATNITSTGATTFTQTGDSFVRLGSPAGASVSVDIADVPTVSEFNARTLVSGSYFDPTADTVATVTNLSNLPTMPTDWLTSTGLSDAAKNEIRDNILPESNVALSNLVFLFVAASDHATPVTGATGTAVTRSIDGAAFAAGTGTLAEIGNGIYQYDTSAVDLNGGIIIFRFTGTGGTPGAPDDAFLTVVTGTGV